MDQTLAKKELQELIKRDDLKNKICIDCSNPNPQWASLSFAVFLCLQCAGVHRGFGVHVSFVRSVSMDTWQEDQIRRMKIGGNAPFREFMETYSPADKGGYRADANPHDIYHCWAAEQYKEKLNYELEGKPWSPSNPSPGYNSPSAGSDSPGRPASAQGLRKSRASGRSATGSSLRQDSSSPASFTNSPPNASLSNSVSGTISSELQKSANESYFANLGSLNASRPADLPPSQGGRYQGFGNSPSPASQHPSFGLSSSSAPTLSDLQENPSAALSKGWSLFSAAVVGASRAVSESVIQPGLERVRDPNFQASIKGYVDEAGKRVGAASSTANQWSKRQLGVDVADTVGGLVDTMKDKFSGVGYEGYGALATSHDADEWGHYHDAEDDFFGEFADKPAGSAPGTVQTASVTATAPASTSSTAPQAKKTDDWDEWKDF